MVLSAMRHGNRRSGMSSQQRATARTILLRSTGSRRPDRFGHNANRIARGARRRISNQSRVEGFQISWRRFRCAFPSPIGAGSKRTEWAQASGRSDHLPPLLPPRAPKPYSNPLFFWGCRSRAGSSDFPGAAAEYESALLLCKPLPQTRFDGSQCQWLKLRSQLPPAGQLRNCNRIPFLGPSFSARQPQMDHKIIVFSMTASTAWPAGLNGLPIIYSTSLFFFGPFTLDRAANERFSTTFQPCCCRVGFLPRTFDAPTESAAACRGRRLAAGEQCVGGRTHGGQAKHLPPFLSAGLINPRKRRF